MKSKKREYIRVRIRKAKESDIRKIISVINHADIIYKKIVPREHWRKPFVTKSQIFEEIKNKRFFVATETDSNIIGVGSYEPVETIAIIQRLYVHPKHQRKGVGSTLLRKIEKDAKRNGCLKAILLVNKDAWWATQFYNKHNFTTDTNQRNKNLDNLREQSDILLSKQFYPLSCFSPSRNVRNGNWKNIH